jgi:hypothetical protein
MSTSTKELATLQVKRPVVEKKEGVESKKSTKVTKLPMCMSLTWNSLGRKLFAGFTDGLIRVWHVNQEFKG